MKYNKSGFYTTGKLENNTIVKKIQYHGAVEEKFGLEIFPCTIEGIKNYVKKLKEAGVEIADVKDIYVSNQDLYIIQDYIVGKTLNEYLLSENAIVSKEQYDFFEQLLKIQRKILSYNSDLRIDFNLNNFIISNKKLILVDIIPPIYIKDKRINMQDKKANIVYSLYCEPEWQIIAVISYWILAKMNYNIKNNLEELINQLFLLANRYFYGYFCWENIVKIGVYNENAWFHQRLKIIKDYFDEKISFNNMYSTFREYSLSETFREK